MRQLLAWGYGAAVARISANEEEDTITQYIKEEIDAITQDAYQNDNSSYPRWCKNFLADDQVPISGTHRIGKHRLKADFRITFHKQNQKADAFFEAKRLYIKSGASIYIGKDGMGCFLDGSYPSPRGNAYMLGYVQNKDIHTWKQDISKALANNKDQHGFIKDFALDFSSPIPQEWATLHRTKTTGDIIFYHILINCKK